MAKPGAPCSGGHLQKAPGTRPRAAAARRAGIGPGGRRAAGVRMRG